MIPHERQYPVHSCMEVSIKCIISSRFLKLVIFMGYFQAGKPYFSDFVSIIGYAQI